MIQTYVPYKKPLWKRVRWVNVLLVATILALIILFADMIHTYYENKEEEYRIVYVEYVMQRDDTLLKVVQDLNDFYPDGWDARDLVHIAVQENSIKDVAKIQEGKRILIPIAHERK